MHINRFFFIDTDVVNSFASYFFSTEFQLRFFIAENICFNIFDTRIELCFFRDRTAFWNLFSCAKPDRLSDEQISVYQSPFRRVCFFDWHIVLYYFGVFCIQSRTIGKMLIGPVNVDDCRPKFGKWTLLTENNWSVLKLIGNDFASIRRKIASR